MGRDVDEYGAVLDLIDIAFLFSGQAVKNSGRIIRDRDIFDADRAGLSIQYTHTLGLNGVCEKLNPVAKDMPV